MWGREAIFKGITLKDSESGATSLINPEALPNLRFLYLSGFAPLSLWVYTRKGERGRG